MLAATISRQSAASASVNRNPKMIRSALLSSSAGVPWLDISCWTAPAVVVMNAA